MFYLRLKLQRTEADRPRLQVDDGVLHCPLVVFAHVLVHVRVVGADVLLRAAVGHRAELQGRVLLLRVLELVKQREVRGRGRQEGGGGGLTRARRPSSPPTSRTDPQLVGLGHTNQIRGTSHFEQQRS